MNKVELERKLTELDLLKVFYRGEQKRYIKGDTLIVNGNLRNVVNVFGVYFRNNKYSAFVTDSERGLPDYLKTFDTEEEACEALYDLVNTINYIHNKKKGELGYARQ